MVVLLLLLFRSYDVHMQTAADQIAANYHSVVAGHGVLPVNLVDRDRGY